MGEKDTTWKLGFWSCNQEPVPCSLATCCCCFGVGVIQYRDKQKLDNNATVMTLCAPCIGCCFGAAWNRAQLRTILGLEENFWKDCALYMVCCFPCLSVQEYYQVELSIRANAGKES